MPVVYIVYMHIYSISLFLWLFSHVNQLRSSTHPHLLNKAAYDLPDTFGIDVHTSIRNKFRSLSRSSQVISDVHLGQKVAIVTGANSGLGRLAWSNLTLPHLCVRHNTQSFVYVLNYTVYHDQSC